MDHTERGTAFEGDTDGYQGKARGTGGWLAHLALMGSAGSTLVCLLAVARGENAWTCGTNKLVVSGSVATVRSAGMARETR